MNLVQLAEQAKNLSNQQLQQMLQQPDGQMPPFILAAEAARRQDIEQSAQAQQSDPTTVLDDLMQSRAQAAGVNGLTNQMAQGMPADQAPAMPQPQEDPQQQMANGGGVRRFATGSILNAAQSGSPYRGRAGSGGYMPNEKPDMGFGLFDIFGDWTTGYGPTDPYVQEMNKRKAEQAGGIAGLSDAENAQEINRLKQTATGQPGGVADLPPAPASQPDPAAVNKQVDTAQKEVAMDAKPSTTATPTTGNAVDAEDMRDRIAAIYGEDNADLILGMSPTAYTNIAKALLDTTPGVTHGQRWANAAGAMAADQEAVAAARAASKREGAMALLNYDMKQADQSHDDSMTREGWSRDDQRYKDQLAIEQAKQDRADRSAAADSYRQGLEVQSSTYKARAEDAQKTIADITERYKAVPGMEMKPEDKLAYENAVKARDANWAWYQQFQTALTRAYGVEMKAPEMIGPDGRPIPVP